MTSTYFALFDVVSLPLDYRLLTDFKSNVLFLVVNLEILKREFLKVSSFVI